LSLSLSPRPGVQHTDGRRPTVVRASGQSDLRTAGAAASLSLTANLDAKGGERLAVAEPWTITGRCPQRVYPNSKSVCPPTGSHAQISANSNEDRPTSAGTDVKGRSVQRPAHTHAYGLSEPDWPTRGRRSDGRRPSQKADRLLTYPRQSRVSFESHHSRLVKWLVCRNPGPVEVLSRRL
ncbi:hypothetical protein CSHISOI_08181, partial [Colletotrichum shisoi]